MDGFVLAFLKYIDSSVLAHLLVHTVPYGPTSGFPLNLVPQDFHSREFLEYHGYYERKATKNPVVNRMPNQLYSVSQSVCQSIS